MWNRIFKQNIQMKQKILNATKDSVRKLLFYDRKHDEELTVGEIQKAVEVGELTKQDIINQFIEELNTQW